MQIVFMTALTIDSLYSNKNYCPCEQFHKKVFFLNITFSLRHQGFVYKQPTTVLLLIICLQRQFKSALHLLREERWGITDNNGTDRWRLNDKDQSTSGTERVGMEAFCQRPVFHLFPIKVMLSGRSLKSNDSQFSRRKPISTKSVLLNFVVTLMSILRGYNVNPQL